jgi:hypothetical protein
MRFAIRRALSEPIRFTTVIGAVSPSDVPRFVTRSFDRCSLAPENHIAADCSSFDQLDRICRTEYERTSLRAQGRRRTAEDRGNEDREVANHEGAAARQLAGKAFDTIEGGS